MTDRELKLKLTHVTGTPSIFTSQYTLPKMVAILVPCHLSINRKLCSFPEEEWPPPPRPGLCSVFVCILFRPNSSSVLKKKVMKPTKVSFYGISFWVSCGCVW